MYPQVLKMDVGSSLRPGFHKQNLKAQGAWGGRGRDGRVRGGMNERRGREGKCRRDMTPKERARKRRPGAWETNFSKESSKPESMPASLQGQGNARSLPSLDAMPNSQEVSGSVGKKGGGGGKQRGVKMQESHTGSISPSGCPPAVPMPSSPKGPANMSGMVRTLNWDLETKV